MMPLQRNDSNSDSDFTTFPSFFFRCCYCCSPRKSNRIWIIPIVCVCVWQLMCSVRWNVEYQHLSVSCSERGMSVQIEMVCGSNWTNCHVDSSSNVWWTNIQSLYLSISITNIRTNWKHACHHHTMYGVMYTVCVVHGQRGQVIVGRMENFVIKFQHKLFVVRIENGDQKANCVALCHQLPFDDQLNFSSFMMDSIVQVVVQRSISGKRWW